MSRNRSNALRQSGQDFREGKLGNVATVPMNLPPSGSNFFNNDLPDNIKLNFPPPAPSPAPSPAPPPASYTDASSTTKSPAPLFNDNDYTPSEIEKIITGLKGRDIAVNFGNIRKYRDLNFNNTENQCAWMCKKQILKKTRGTVTNPTERCNFKNLKLQFVRSKYEELKQNIFESTIPKFTLCHNHIRKFLGVKIKKDVLTSTKERNIDDFICFYNVTPKKDGKEVGNLIKKNSNANCIISNNTIKASKKIKIGAEFFL